MTLAVYRLWAAQVARGVIRGVSVRIKPGAALAAVQRRGKKKRRLATARTFKLEQRHLGLAT